MFNDIVAFAFRLINFFVLIALAFYLFKKYMLRSIEETMSAQEAYHSGLKEQLSALEYRLEELENEKIALEKKGALLQLKVHRWHEEFNNFIDARQQEKAILQRQADTRSQRQTDNFHKEKIITIAAPRAIKNVTDTLQEAFKDQPTRDHYLNQLIASMEREIHGN